MTDIASLFGQIDIYLFDQIQRGRIVPGLSIFDAGCGGGRNLLFFLREGYDVSGVDSDPHAIARVQSLAAQLQPDLPWANFRAEEIETSSFADGVTEVVVSSAVLHFARDEAHFERMLLGSWRLLRPGGLFFCRLASTIGMEGRFHPISGRRFALPDGTQRFLVDEPYLLDWTARLEGTLVDPIKTTVVQDSRCMTTWVVRKKGS